MMTALDQSIIFVDQRTGKEVFYLDKTAISFSTASMVRNDGKI
jgi:hypothetical protein